LFLSELLKQPKRRLIPSRGMPIDLPTWNAAHDYHSNQQRMHNISMHYAGIVTGLYVSADPSGNRFVTVHPGVAVTDSGQNIVITENYTLEVSSLESSLVYVVLEYREILEDPRFTIGHDENIPTFAVEGYQIAITSDLPKDEFIELARIQMSQLDSKVDDPYDWRVPSINAIDHRFRKLSRSGITGCISVGVAVLPEESDSHPVHLKGVMSLIRTLNMTTNVSASFSGLINLSEIPQNLDLLIMAGQTKFMCTDSMNSELAEFLEGGGVLFGEACNGTNGNTDEGLEFRLAFNELAQNLNSTFAPVDIGNTLLNSVYQFGSPPDSVYGPGVVISDGRIIYSDSDYGCIWEGGPENSRELIRAATEFGINIVASPLPVVGA
jgi:hypothetical protein